MPFAINIGDVISLAHLIKDVIQALDASKGSAAEYQDSTQKLRLLGSIVREVETTDRLLEGTEGSEGVREALHCTFVQCRRFIATFLQRIKKFDVSLQEGGGSGSRLRDTSKKIQWQICRSDDLSDFRAEVSGYCSAFSVLLQVASVRLLDSREQRLNARLSSSAQEAVPSSQEMCTLLREVRDQLHNNKQQSCALMANAPTSAKTLGNDGGGWMPTISCDINKALKGLFMTVFASYRVLVDLRNGLSTHLERFVSQEPFVLVDSHGRQMPVHLDTIHSWGALDAWLDYRFTGMPGHTKVRNRDFVLHNDVANKDIVRNVPLDNAILPGQKIVMCMVFVERSYGDVNSCPKCSAMSSTAEDVDIKCIQCGLWYRRKSEPEPYMALTSSAQPLTKDQSAHVSPNDAMDPKMRLIRNEGEDEDTIASFKRVRIVSLAREPSSETPNFEQDDPHMDA